MSEESEKRAMVDRFEFFAAILLGLAAISTALSSFQAGMWDGKQAEAYGRANTEATAAAAERARATVEMSKDAQIDITAYQLIEQGLNNAESNPSVSNSSFEIASYLYTRQMSDAGYKALGLPPEAKKDSGDDEEKTEALKGDILDKASNKDLVGDENYLKEMLAKSDELNAQSQKTFKEGNDANDTGDKFELANVLFAVSMFFMGIALVFKTEIKWKVLIAGGLILIVPFVYMLTLPWTF
ncbi:MAG: hypothetical protein KA746_04200 [Pyrinomonadaceae bacterium]|nr:hypothetical protein [Pyrinomonadaceae bacterium]MBP6212889.1 hypothetical protein [Pyrinomonadaceae bacterium]